MPTWSHFWPAGHFGYQCISHSQSDLLRLPATWLASFWGVGRGLSKSRKFSDLSLTISTRCGIFSAVALKGVDCIRSRSACLENGIRYNSSLELQNHTSIWNSFLGILVPGQHLVVLPLIFPGPSFTNTFSVFHFHTEFDLMSAILSSSGRRKCPL